MIYECYLDDSKDKTQEVAYVCAGFYGAKRAWQNFEKAWQDQLKIERIDYFKSSECRRLCGQFARFSLIAKPTGHALADQVRQRLQKVLYDSSGIYGVGVVVPVAEHDAVLKHQSADIIYPPKYIYHRAFELALLRTKLLACKTSKDRVDFAHDEGPDFKKLYTLYLSFKTKNPMTGAYLKGFISLDDKKHGALQAADMFANSIMSTTMNLLKMKPDTSSEDILMFNRSKISVWTKEIAEKILARNLGSRDMPIPESLANALIQHQI